jgi:type I restriction enzyme S subunit
MTNWKEYKLGEIAEIKNGKSRPKVKGDIPVYGGNGILDYSESSNVMGETIIIGRVGAYCGSVYFENKEIWVSDNALYAKPKKGFNSKYLYYLLKEDNLNQYAGGSSHPLLTQGRLNDLKFSIPNLPTQTAIAEILSSLDDKIELNNKINQELENLAQTLFKQWFIDFEFPNEKGDPYKSSGGEMVESELGEIPKGWEVGVLEDLCIKMNSGGTPSTKREDYYNGDILWYSTKELQDEFLFTSERTITLEGLENSSAKLFPENTVVMAIYAAPTVGRLGILSKEASFNQAALGFVAKSEIGYEYLYLLLKYLRDDLNNLANGAAQQNLNVRIVKSYKNIVPNKDILNNFQFIINPFFKAIKINQKENQELTNLRDTLLPKLISGELEVADIMAEKV